jgi:hypothetical protein
MDVHAVGRRMRTAYAHSWDERASLIKAQRAWMTWPQPYVNGLLEALHLGYEWSPIVTGAAELVLLSQRLLGTRHWFVVAVLGLNRVAEVAHCPFKHVDRVFFRSTMPMGCSSAYRWPVSQTCGHADTYSPLDIPSQPRTSGTDIPGRQSCAVAVPSLWIMTLRPARTSDIGSVCLETVARILQRRPPVRGPSVLIDLCGVISTKHTPTNRPVETSVGVRHHARNQTQCR